MRISDWSSDVCSSDLEAPFVGYLVARELFAAERDEFGLQHCTVDIGPRGLDAGDGQHSHAEVGFGNDGTVGDTVMRVEDALDLRRVDVRAAAQDQVRDRKSTRLNSSH